jgi:hypothetical protein
VNRPPRSGPQIWAPRPGMGGVPPARELEGYADALVRILRTEGPLGVPALRERAQARYWGPGSFNAALRRAREQGRVRRTGFRTYAASDSGS